MLKALPEGVPSHRDPACVLDLDIHLHVAEHVVADGDVPLAGCAFTGAAGEALVRTGARDPDVGGARGFVGVLDGAAGDGHLGDGATRGIQPHVRRRWTICDVVALDVARTDLEVPHVPSPAHHATTAVVADVAVGDVGLVEVHRVVENADARVVIEVGVGQHHVPVAPDQVHGVAGLADHHPADGELHGSIGLDAVGLRMTPHDLNPRNHRRAFVFPHRGLYRAWSGRPAVAAGKPECRAGALHQQGGGAVPADAGNAGLCQIKLEGFGEPVGTLWKVEVSRAGADRLLENCGVVV